MASGKKVETSWAKRLYDAYVFDMDGTIYLGDHFLPGAKRLIEELRRRNITVRFLSNNPTKNPQQYAQKLERLGLKTPVTEIANTVVTTVRWLKHHYPKATVFPIAEPPLIEAIQKAGIRISENPSEIDIVIASYDRTFEYRKLQIAFDALWFHKRAILIGTNPDKYCPLPEGHGEPDCAAIIAAIEACTGCKCQEIIGKPNPNMLTAALGDLLANEMSEADGLNEANESTKAYELNGVHGTNELNDIDKTDKTDTTDKQAGTDRKLTSELLGLEKPASELATEPIKAAKDSTNKSTRKPPTSEQAGASNKSRIDLRNVLMVGDRVSTDIKMAVDVGVDSALPLTGESQIPDVEALPETQRPTYVLERIDHLIPKQIWDELGWTDQNG